MTRKIKKMRRKINYDSVVDLRDSIEKTYFSFLAQLDFNVLEPLESGEEVKANELADFRETTFVLLKKLEVLDMETK